MTRTDIHRPSAPEFDPEGYQCFGIFDLNTGASDYVGPGPASTVSPLVDAGWSFSAAPHGSGQCSHCGAHIRYAALMGHEATKTLLYIGETCLDNRFELTKGEFQTLRKAALLNRERVARSTKVDAFLAEYPDMVWLSYANNLSVAGGVTVWYAGYDWETEYATKEEALQHATNDGAWVDEGGVAASFKRGTTFCEKTRLGEKFSILNDMHNKMNRYGDLSPAQVNFARKILGWISDAQVRLDERAAATTAAVAAGVEVPEGRVVVTGTVLSTKGVESQWGFTLKMLVQHESGWKVWGTVPSSIDVTKGDTVEFTATVTKSDDDSLFGFYSRPSKARVL